MQPSQNGSSFVGVATQVAFEKKRIGKRLNHPCLYKLRFSDSTSTCGDGDGCCIKSLRPHRPNRSTLLCKWWPHLGLWVMWSFCLPLEYVCLATVFKSNIVVVAATENVTREAKAETNPSRRWMHFVSSFKIELLIMTSCYSNSYTRRNNMTQVPSLPVTASVLSYPATRFNIHGNIVSMA